MPALSRTLGALALAVALGSTAAAAPPTIQDDYAAARAEAKRLGVPLVVDVWAPW